MKTLFIKNSASPVLLDDCDDALVRKPDYHWYQDIHGYAVCWLPEKQDFLRMHNFILGYNGPDDIDHIDRNKINNQRSNLRIVPHFVNLHNTKVRTDNTNGGYKGVFQNRAGNYGYQVYVNKKKYTKQGFKTKQEAFEARNLFAEQEIERVLSCRT